ncbi:MAG TPA: ATP phosphoribosyltransferase [Anaerolineae bacterium]|nr:ATP phosphoribosyltransferase [Anaerolineae bacterium]
MSRTDIRLAIPSKGLLGRGALDFLEACGFKVYRPNPRQYAATIPNLPGLVVMFQRPGDIVTSLQEGSIDFGFTGLDVLEEGRSRTNDQILTLHDQLGFAPCSLQLAVPEELTTVRTVKDLPTHSPALGPNTPLRIATKFPNLTAEFLDKNNITNYTLVYVEGTLEIAPVIGFADMIADLVSTGTTLRDNHLRPLEDGTILASQACLVAHKPSLQNRPEVLKMARELLEFIEAYLRAANCYLLFANMRGPNPQAIADKMLAETTITGLQGPTISPVVPPQANASPDNNWFAINIIVRKPELTTAIRQLRAIGGSGVIVSPVTYIFEEEPERYQAMLQALNTPTSEVLTTNNSTEKAS